MAYRVSCCAILTLTLALALASCSERAEVLPDAGMMADAFIPSLDAEMDAPVDAPADALPDAGEPQVDAGPPTANHAWSRTIPAVDVTEMAGSDKYLTLVGRFNMDIDLGDGLHTVTGDDDSFVASYSTTEGAFRWSRVLSGPGSITVYDAAADQNDNVYVIGSFRTSVLIEDGEFFSAVGFRDAVLVSYDKDGVFRWAKHFTDATGRDVAVTPEGAVTVRGRLTSSADFGGTVLTASADETEYLARYDSLGTLQWARTVPGNMVDIAVGPSGEVAVGGSFYGSIDFGGTTHTATGGDAMVAMYRSDGTFRWSTSFTGAGREAVEGMDIDSRGYVVVAGCFDEDFNMGGETYVTSTDAGWVGTLDETGAYVWSQPLQTTWRINLDDVDTGPLNNVYLTGMHWDQVDFGGGIQGVPDSGGSDGFMASYGPDGDYRWSYVYVDARPVSGTALHIDSRQSVYLAGQFEVRVDLGGGPLFGTDGQVFLSRFTQ